ncbi:MAG TPA: hypothetical protein VGL94_10210 [Ktedonobacteraceae bacterium]
MEESIMQAPTANENDQSTALPSDSSQDPSSSVLPHLEFPSFPGKKA